MSQMSDLPASAILLAEGCSESFDDSGSTVTWRFEVPYADRNNFLRAVAGLPQQVTIGGTTVTRLVPLKNPDYYNCYASSIRSVAIDGTIASPSATDPANPGIAFDFYRYDVTFSTPTFPTSGTEPYITIERGVALETVTSNGSGYVFPSDGLYLAQPVDIPITTVEYRLTFHRLPSLNNALYDSLAGSVNSAVFRGVAVGQCLYLGCSSSGQQTLGGQASYEATHAFQVRSISWQQVLRPDGKGFEAPVWAANSNRYRLPTTDLNQLYGN